MDNTLRTFVAVSEIGDEYTIEQVDPRGGTDGHQRVEFVCSGVGRLTQLGAHLFQSVERPELILTEKAA
ncbi:MAG TPA: hypothetical protein VF595_11760 [Tepidisphaeraceae bacterium]|jgi:hypothetical protein